METQTERFMEFQFSSEAKVLNNDSDLELSLDGEEQEETFSNKKPTFNQNSKSFLMGKIA